MGGGGGECQWESLDSCMHATPCIPHSWLFASATPSKLPAQVRGLRSAGQQIS